MSKQRLLFEPQRSPWVDQLWRHISPEKRHEIIAALAEMARIALMQTQPNHRQGGKGASDES